MILERTYSMALIYEIRIKCEKGNNNNIIFVNINNKTYCLLSMIWKWLSNHKTNFWHLKILNIAENRTNKIEKKDPRQFLWKETPVV